MWSTVVMQKGRVKKKPQNKWIYCSCNWYKGHEQMNHNEPDDNHLLFSANTQSKCQQPWTSCVWLWPMLCQRSIIYRTIRILQLSYYISWQPECTEAWGCFFYSCCDDEALFIQWGKKKKLLSDRGSKSTFIDFHGTQCRSLILNLVGKSYIYWIVAAWDKEQ